MRVLIVTKTTNMELFGERVKKRLEEGRRPLEDFQRLKAAHDDHYATLDTLRGELSKRSIAFDVLVRSEAFSTISYDAVVSVGGDGTLLSASHRAPAGILLVGVRSSASSVGFLCAYGRESVSDLAEALSQNRVKKIEVSRLQAEIVFAEDGRLETTRPVLNDFLYANTNAALTTRYRLKLGAAVERQKSSGIWVSTAIGSTAAIKAAGGLTMDPEARDFQFRVRELYRNDIAEANCEGGRFDPDQTELSIENLCEAAMLAVDGQHGEVLLQFGDRVRFERGPSLLLGRA